MKMKDNTGRIKQSTISKQVILLPQINEAITTNFYGYNKQ